LEAEVNARRERVAEAEAAPVDGLTLKAAVLESRQVNMRLEAANFIVDIFLFQSDQDERCSRL
jgi:hypothetical protein